MYLLYSSVVDFKDLSVDDQKRGLQGETFGLTETAPVSKECIYGAFTLDECERENENFFDLCRQHIKFTF